MTISCVIPTYNRKEQTLRAINSVLNQSYPPNEIIVVEDASSNPELALAIKEMVGDTGKSAPSEGDGVSISSNVDSFASVSSTRDRSVSASGRNESVPIHYYHFSDNQGVSRARNFGIAVARGDWIALLDSDDEWLEDRLKLQVDLLRASDVNSITLVHGNEIWLKNDKLMKQKKIHRKSGGYLFMPFLKLCLLSPSASLFKKSLWESVGGFREDFPVCEDYDFWLKCALRTEIGFVEDEIIVKHGGHEDQLSEAYHSMDYWRIKSLLDLLDSVLPTQSLERTQSIESEPHMMTVEQTQALNAEILRKADVFLRGQEKHGITEFYHEIRNRISKLAFNRTASWIWQVTQ